MYLMLLLKLLPTMSSLKMVTQVLVFIYDTYLEVNTPSVRNYPALSLLSLLLIKAQTCWDTINLNHPYGLI
jgi:hypothetical protein